MTTLTIYEQERLQKIEKFTKELNEAELRMREINETGEMKYPTETMRLEATIRIAKENLERLNADREAERLERKKAIRQAIKEGGIRKGARYF